MSQASLNVPTTGPSPPTTFAGVINGVADALVSKNSGATAPANFPTSPGAPTAFQDWADTSPGGGLVDEREYDGSNWLIKGAQDQTNHVWMPKVGGGSGTIAAAATTDIGSVRQSYVLVTGSVPGTPITSFGNNALLNTGETRFLRFSAAGILTYNAASMILPAAADLPFNAGDTVQATYLGGGNWLAYDFRSNVSPVGRNTGDMFEKWGTGTTAGGVRLNGGTIGNGASGGTERANADTVNLFIFLYINDTSLTVSGGRTAPGNTRAAAITDFNLNKTIALPTVLPAESRPTRQILLSGAGATYTTPAGCSKIIVRMIGGGGGGGASSTNNGSTGNPTSWAGGTYVANGGTGGTTGVVGSPGQGVAGGTGGAGAATLRLPGSSSVAAYMTNDGFQSGGCGAPGLWGLGAGFGGNNTNGAAGAANTGAGGGGGSGTNNTNRAGIGGAAGEYVEVEITSPTATYNYTVGAAANGGAAGGQAGGNGGSGIIIVDEYYSGATSMKYMAL